MKAVHEARDGVVRAAAALVFLFYLTSPLYERLLAWRLPRAAALLAPPLAALTLLLPAGWLLARQFALLIAELFRAVT